ncbi:TetR/AcrR family transcriptional regulator [Arthrobacter sp. NPDC093128]|uniref:TetR/AcrR family transcriptional regulator n=1 Tax=Arthrobacter sp. NPDC093128 TaxID=3154979 RepID=UPI00343AFE5F
MSLRNIMDDPAFRIGAFKQASQRRSREKLARVLDVTRQLLIKEGLQAVSTTRVAADAGISVGWMYAYFENRQALLEEILIGCLRGLDEAMDDAGLDLGGPDWRPKADAGVRACLEYFSTDAAFRGLWFADEFSGRMLQVNRMHDDVMAAWLAGTITHIRKDAPKISMMTVMEVFVGMLDKGVDLAFRQNPDAADPEVLEEVRRSSVDYLTTFLE